MWYGLQLGVPAFCIYYATDWIPLRPAIVFIARENRVAAAGRQWEDIIDDQDVEDMTLIWSWRTGLVNSACFELVILLVRALAPFTMIKDACLSFWTYDPLTLRQQVADLIQQRDAARNDRSRYFVASQIFKRLVLRCRNEHQDFNDQDESMRRIRELEQQRDYRQAAYEDLTLKYTLLHQASSALTRAGGPTRSVERLPEAAAHTKDLHRSQIRMLIASFVKSGAEVVKLQDRTKTLEEDLRFFNDGRATMLWREKEKENLELEKRFYEQILERDAKIMRLRDGRDDNTATLLGLDARGQQALRKQREQLTRAEDELAHAEMTIEKMRENETRCDEEKEEIKKTALYGEPERFAQLYRAALAENEDLSEKLKRFEYLAEPENDIDAYQRRCNEEKEKLRHEIADKTQQISTYKAQIDHAMGSLEWADNRFDPLDKYLGFVSGAKAEIRRLAAAMQYLESLNLAPQGPRTRQQFEVLNDLTTERYRLLDEKQNLVVIVDDLQNTNNRQERTLGTLNLLIDRINAQKTNLQNQITELRVQLREGLDITRTGNPIVMMFAKNILALEMEILRRGKYVNRLPAIPGLNGVPRIEREPNEIMIWRIVHLFTERYHHLRALVEESEPPWLGAAEDWVDDNTETPENVDARTLHQTLTMGDIFEYLGTLDHETILFYREVIRRQLGIRHNVELPERSRSPSPARSPSSSPPPLPPSMNRGYPLPPRLMNRVFFPPVFTQYEEFDLDRWHLYPFGPEERTPALSIPNAIQRSIQAQWPEQGAGNLLLAEVTRHLRAILGGSLGSFNYPINEGDGAEALYRSNHSFILRIVITHRREGGTVRHVSRDIVYPDDLDVLEPRRIVVLYLNGRFWQGMGQKPESDAESGHVSEPESDHELDLNRPLYQEFDERPWRADLIPMEWKIPGETTNSELHSISAVARSFHWQYPGVLFPAKMTAQQACVDLYQRFNRRYPRYHGEYTFFHIQGVLNGILGRRTDRAHFRLALVRYEYVKPTIRNSTNIFGSDHPESPILYILYIPSMMKIQCRGMRRRREDDEARFLGNLDWNLNEAPLNDQPISPVPPFNPPPAVSLAKIENYEAQFIRADFNRVGWEFFINWDHFSQGLARGNEDWAHDCAPEALYSSLQSQYAIGNLSVDDVFRAFRNVFPNHSNTWQDEEVARVLKFHQGLGSLALGIVRGNIFDNQPVIINHWHQPESYDGNENILFVAQITDQRRPPGDRPDHRYHWVGMRYQRGGQLPKPPPHKAKMTMQPHPNPPQPQSLVLPLLQAATVGDGMTGTAQVPQPGAAGWANFQTTESYASKTGKAWEAPPPRPLERVSAVNWEDYFHTHHETQKLSEGLGQLQPSGLVQQQVSGSYNPHPMDVEPGWGAEYPPLPPPTQSQTQAQTVGKGTGFDVWLIPEELELARRFKEEVARGEGSKEGKKKKKGKGKRVEKERGRGNAAMVMGRGGERGTVIGVWRGGGRTEELLGSGDRGGRGRGKGISRGRGGDRVGGRGRGGGEGRGRGGGGAPRMGNPPAGAPPVDEENEDYDDEL